MAKTPQVERCSLTGLGTSKREHTMHSKTGVGRLEPRMFFDGAAILMSIISDGIGSS